MLKFAANISTMFNEEDELDRLNHAAELGFEFVEWLFPYNRDKHDIAARLRDQKLKLILINAALGEPSKRDRGIGALPHRVTDFKHAVTLGIEYAQQLDIPMIHVMAGQCPEPKDQPLYLETFAKNLRWASEQINGGSPRLLVEPLNLVDSPNYLISSVEQALDVINLADANIGLQFDFYHLQIMQGNLAHRLQAHFDDIAHIQFSSVPGRHEPQYGEVNCQYLFQLLETLNYDGYVGCEYGPKHTVEDGLTWARPYNIGKRTHLTESS